MEFAMKEYTEDWENIHWQKGFSEELEGLTMEKQLRCYGWTTCKQLAEIPYKELEDKCRENRRYFDSIEPVKPEIVLVKEGKMVGVERALFHHILPDGTVEYDNEEIKPYERYCYHYESDNNGAGYKEGSWYKYLICLPVNHSLW